MATTPCTLSPQLEQAVVHTIALLDALERALARPRPYSPNDADRYALLHLQGTALFVSHHGRHLAAGGDDRARMDHTPGRDLHEDLCQAHRQLADQVTGLEPFEVLEFVTSVGTLCQGVRRHVRNH